MHIFSYFVLELLIWRIYHLNFPIASYSIQSLTVFNILDERRITCYQNPNERGKIVIMYLLDPFSLASLLPPLSSQCKKDGKKLAWAGAVGGGGEALPLP